MQHNHNVAYLNKVFELQKSHYRQAPYLSYQTRKSRLERTLRLLESYETQLFEAMDADFGGRSPIASLSLDMVGAVVEIKHALKHLKKWMRPKRRGANFPLNVLGAKAGLIYEPKGVIANISTWNFPLLIWAAPLAGIFSGGNSCIVKINENSLEAGKVFDQAVREFFSEDELAVVQGGADVSAAICNLPFDHILFTGSERAGRLVMGGAAKNLVPVTLELGGKCPTILSRSADIDTAAKKIIYGKMTNAGQICLAPDFLMVPEDQNDQIVKALIAQANIQFPDPVNNPDYTGLVNDAQVTRIQEMVEDAREKGAQITIVDAPKTPVNNRKMPLHIVENVNGDMRLMQEEIFGPVLPIETYQDFNQVVERASKRPKPLASYYFGKDRSEEDKVLKHVPSGATTFNDVIFHALQKNLPFGGVGNSGMGQYMSVEGFYEFTNPRAIFRQSSIDIGKMMRPPYNKKIEKNIRKMM